MATAAILGASGFAGQETLDRLLAHPELELLSLGSDSLAGRAASALDVRLNGHLPAFVPNEGCRDFTDDTARAGPRWVPTRIRPGLPAPKHARWV